ncbi:cyclic phosphodiesterase-like protein, partial [Tanacetum coccineum]
VMQTGAHCWSHFGYKSETPYMPHLSILYGYLTEEEKKRAQEKANALDESIKSLSFPITRLGLYKTDPEDKTLKSWEKVSEVTLKSN